MTVLEKCVALGGKHIRLFGVDMAGPFAGCDFDEEASRKREGWDRWKHERETLNEAIKKADSLGINIEVISGDSLK